MRADPRLIEQVEIGLWRPHWLTPAGTLLAVCTCVALLIVLIGFEPGLVTWLQNLKFGGLAGGSNTPDRINGLRIVAGFCAMMAVVGSTLLQRASARRRLLLAALDGGDGVVWIYRELAQLTDGQEQVLVFGMADGAKLRMTLPEADAVALWTMAQAAFSTSSQGHDNGQERRFATRPMLMQQQPRCIEGVQQLRGRDRAR